MGILNCSCPAPTTIGAISDQTCNKNFGQIQKIIIQRKGYSFDGTTGKDITVKADWQTVFTASDDTKAQITPLIYNPIITAGEAITNGGGDNSTLNGVSELVGVNPTTFTAELRSINAQIERELKAYICETDLVVFLVNDSQQIIAKNPSASATTTFEGIPIQEFFVGDRTANGLNTKDMNALSFSFPSEWSNLIAYTAPAFNPLTEL